MTEIVIQNVLLLFHGHVWEHLHIHWMHVSNSMRRRILTCRCSNTFQSTFLVVKQRFWPLPPATLLRWAYGFWQSSARRQMLYGQQTKCWEARNGAENGGGHYMMDHYCGGKWLYSTFMPYFRSGHVLIRIWNQQNWELDVYHWWRG